MAKFLRAVLVIAVIFFFFVYVAGTLASLATNEALMRKHFEQHADTASSGVPSTEYAALAHAITTYLDGKLETPQIPVDRSGVVSDAFSQDELTHLQDIHGLVKLARALRWGAIVLAVVLSGAYFLLRKQGSQLLRLVRPVTALRVASGIFLTALLVIALWSLVDFHGLFVAFHRVLFRNDLWQLNAETDLLLQLMPRPFFTAYALEALKQNAFLLLILPLAIFGLRNQEGKQP